jgi:hypothetical protein
MSTKISIKWREQTADAPGFHLYDECFETMADGDAAPVYLRLDGVPVELATQAAGVTVTVAIPREMARALGLLSLIVARDDGDGVGAVAAEGLV